jgi:hypothetical protein
VTISALIKAASAWEFLPVDIEDHVKPELLNLGVVDEVWFWPDSKLNPSILRGSIEHYEVPFPDRPNQRWADITYAQQQEPEWQRLVCGKEVIHLVDPEGTRVAKQEDVDRLIEKIILPPDLQDPFNDGVHASTDRAAVIYATAVLFPFAARKILLPTYAEGRLSIPQIAELAEIPTRYAAIVMSDFWPEIHKMLTGEWQPMADGLNGATAAPPPRGPGISQHL